MSGGTVVNDDGDAEPISFPQRFAKTTGVPPPVPPKTNPPEPATLMASDETFTVPDGVNCGSWFVAESAFFSEPPVAPKFVELPPNQLAVSRVALASIMAETRPVLSGTLKVVE